MLVDLRPHWLFLFAPAATTAVALAAAVAIGAQFARAPVALIWVLVALVALPLCWLGVRLARWLGSSLVVTNRRIVLRHVALAHAPYPLLPRLLRPIHSRQPRRQRHQLRRRRLARSHRVLRRRAFSIQRAQRRSQRKRTRPRRQSSL